MRPHPDEITEALRRLARAAGQAGSDRPRARRMLRDALAEAVAVIDRLDAATCRTASRGLAVVLFSAAALGWAVVLA